MASKYYRYKESGRCVACGGARDNETLKCTKCREKTIKSERLLRQHYLDNGICPRCGANSLMGDEKSCVECRAKNAEQKAQAREKDREKYRKQANEYKRKWRAEKAEQGLCLVCGKVRKDKTYKLCEKCRKAPYECKDRTETGRLRVDNKLCYYCGEPVFRNYKVCKKHYDISVANLNHPNVDKAREEYKKNVLDKHIKLIQKQKVGG